MPRKKRTALTIANVERRSLRPSSAVTSTSLSSQLGKKSGNEVRGGEGRGGEVGSQNLSIPYEFTLVGLEPSAETTKGRSKGRYVDLWIAPLFLEIFPTFHLRCVR